MASNRLDLMPYIPARTMTTTSFSIDVTTSAASSAARILVYSDSGGAPNIKLVESPNLDCSTTGIKTYTFEFTFIQGTIYYLGVHSNSTQILRGIALGSMLCIGTSAAAGTAQFTLYRSTPAFTEAPSPYTEGVLTSSIGPEVRMSN
jgi:hypothetical protein